MRAFDPFNRRTRCHAASTSVVGCGWPFTSTRSPRKPFIISIMPPPWKTSWLRASNRRSCSTHRSSAPPDGQRQRVLFGVPHQEQTSQALVHLRARAHVRVRVIPVRPRAIGDLELVDVLATVADGQAGMAVGALGHVQAVPVDDRVFGELVRESDADPLTAAQANDRSEVRTGKHLERVGRTLEQAAR